MEQNRRETQLASQAHPYGFGCRNFYFFGHQLFQSPHFTVFMVTLMTSVTYFSSTPPFIHTCFPSTCHATHLCSSTFVQHVALRSSPGDLKVQASSSSKCVSPAVNLSPGKNACATVPPGPSKGYPSLWSAFVKSI